MHKAKITTLLTVAALGALSCIHPLFPKDMFLQHIGTVLILGLLVLDIRKNFLSYFAFLGISIFVMMHIIGARYVYSFVPYNDWFIAALGFDIDNYFNFSRNHYDRFVHFSFGILIFPFLVEWLHKKSMLTFGYCILFSWLCLQTFSMFYELFEWSLTWFISAEAVENYNGQQGDLWDAQKDMGLAMLGSTAMAFFFSLRKQADPNSAE